MIRRGRVSWVVEIDIFFFSEAFFSVIVKIKNFGSSRVDVNVNRNSDGYVGNQKKVGRTWKSLLFRSCQCSLSKVLHLPAIAVWQVILVDQRLVVVSSNISRRLIHGRLNRQTSGKTETSLLSYINKKRMWTTIFRFQMRKARPVESGDDGKATTSLLSKVADLYEFPQTQHCKMKLLNWTRLVST